MGECIQCGAQLTDRYVRVFGEGGVVDGCRECGDRDAEMQTREERFEGGSIPDADATTSTVQWTRRRKTPRPDTTGQTSLTDYA